MDKVTRILQETHIYMHTHIYTHVSAHGETEKVLFHPILFNVPDKEGGSPCHLK